MYVDDNSPDGTGQIADELAAAYPGRIHVLHRAEKKGLGRAYIQGYQEAIRLGADVIGMMDADFSHPPEKITEMSAAIGEYDVVIGSRYVPGGSLDKHWPLWRKALSSFGNFYARTILALPFKDATGGFILWRKTALDKIPLEKVISSGYIFIVEMKYLAHKTGSTIKEIPIYFADRKWGESKMNFRIQLEAAYRIWQVLLRHYSN